MTPAHLSPPPQGELKKFLGKRKFNVLQEAKIRAKKANALVPPDRRKDRFEDTYYQSLRRLVELLTWQYIEGNMRSDGYFYTTYGGICSYQCLQSKKTTKRHLAKLQSWDYIKDIDSTTPGPKGQKRFRYGFWIRLDDWIIESIIQVVSTASYELKREKLKKEKQQKVSKEQNQPSSEPLHIFEERINEAVQTITERTVNHFEHRGKLHSIAEVMSYSLAKSISPDKEDPP